MARARLGLTLVCTGFGLGLSTAVALAPGCVIPDSCPVIATKGADWCASMEGDGETGALESDTGDPPRAPSVVGDVSL